MFVYFIQTAEDIVKLLTRPARVIILVSFYSERPHLIPSGTPSVRAQYTRSGKILRSSTEIAVYLGNGTTWLMVPTTWLMVAMEP